MYSGRLQPIIEALVLNARTQSKPASAPTRWSSLTSLVVAVAVGVMFIGSVILATLADPQPAGDRQQLASQNHHQQQHQNQLLLATLEIPETCRATTVAWGLAASTDLACCTQCHKADSPVPSTEKAIAKSTAACVACHDGTSSDSISAVPNRRDWYLDFDRLRIHVRRKYEQINLQLAIAIAPMRARDVRTSATTTDLEACQVARLEVGVAVVLPKCDELYVERSTHPQHARISMFDVARTKYLPVAACEADRRC